MSLAVLADHMASRGRGPDSMLIHMSPREVQGLQALAMKHGGSLTINPETGLPEAGFLDKLLPAIIGFALAPMTAGTSLAFLGATPMASALTVGGIQALRTGDIGKGISAGLGAYGGAGLGASLAGAGAEAIGSQAAGAGAGITADMAANLADAGITDAGIQSLGNVDVANQALQQQAAERVAAASPFDKISAGFDAAKTNPMSFANKDNLKYLAAAAGPILADQAVTAKGPQTTTKPGMIRPYSYDPYGGTYTAGTPYEATPTKAAYGGLMGMAAGGIAGYGDGDDVPRRTNDGMAQGGMYDFAQRSEPVVRMAKGGVIALAGGGTGVPTYFVENPDVAKAYTENTYGLTPEQFAYTHAEKFGNAETASGQRAPTTQSAGAAYAATHGIDLQKNIDNWVVNNPFATAADVTNALSGSGLTQADVNPYLTANTSISDAQRYALSHLDEIDGLSGLQKGVLTALARNPNMTQSEIDAAQAQYRLSDYDIQSPLIHGYQVANDQTAAAQAYLADPKNADVLAWINSDEGDKYLAAHPEFDLNDIAYTHFQRYGEDEGRKWGVTTPVVKPPVVTPSVVTPPITYNTAGTNAPGGLEGMLGLPPGVSGAGITTVNPNGTITTRPNIPGIPAGGFTGMTDLRNAYTKGGGSLGYVPYAPKTIDEFNTKYNKLTGGSKQSYDYLMGKTPYDPTPSTKTGEIQKPYWESVGRFPAQDKNKNKKYLYDGTKYVLNPDYVKPSYVLAGEKAAALADPDNAPTAKAGEGKKWVWSDEAKKWEAKPIDGSGSSTQVDTTQGGGGNGGDANGGLMKLAGGGMSGRFNLGDYSDGGRLLRGPGDGVSDSIPATIGNKRPARLADGEFVVPARIVSELGNGSTEAGARKLYAMMDRIQKARRGTVGKGRVAKNSRSEKYLPA